MLDFKSLVQSNVNASLIYNLRTGNIVIDSLISIAITSLLMYVMSSFSAVTLKDTLLSWFRRKRCSLLVEARETLTLGQNATSMRFIDGGQDKAYDMIHAVRRYVALHHLEKLDDLRLMPTKSKDKSNPYKILKTRKYIPVMHETKITISYKGIDIMVSYSKNTITHGKEDKCKEYVHSLEISTSSKLPCAVNDPTKSSENSKPNHHILEIPVSSSNVNKVQDESTQLSKKTHPQYELLKEWSQMCYDELVDTQKYKDVEERYYYELHRFKGGQPVFNRYDLNTNRVLENLFFPQKDQFLKLLDDFNNKKGIYSKNILPYRLNILLYGVPDLEKRV